MTTGWGGDAKGAAGRRGEVRGREGEGGRGNDDEQGPECSGPSLRDKVIMWLRPAVRCPPHQQHGQGAHRPRVGAPRLPHAAQQRLCPAVGAHLAAAPPPPRTTPRSTPPPLPPLPAICPARHTSHSTSRTAQQAVTHLPYAVELHIGNVHDAPGVDGECQGSAKSRPGAVPAAVRVPRLVKGARPRCDAAAGVHASQAARVCVRGRRREQVGGWVGVWGRRRAPSRARNIMASPPDCVAHDCTWLHGP